MDYNKKNLIYIISSVLIFFITFMSYREHFVIYGDAILQLSTGRDFLLPEWGTWVPARVTGDFFANVLFHFFYKIIAPIFGNSHIAEVYSIFNAILFSLMYVSLSLASFQYTKLFISLNEKYFFIYSLVFYVLYISKTELGNLTLLMAYGLPVLLGIWFVYPFITYIATRDDPLKSHGDLSSVVFISIFGYLVAFSATNVEVFVVLVLAFCTLFLLLENIVRNPGQKFSSLLKSFLVHPKWFVFGIIYTPLITGLAFIYDMNGGRYLAEKNKNWGSSANEEMSYFQAIHDINLGYGAPVKYFVLVAVVLLIFSIVRKIRNYSKSQIISNYANRIAAIAIILLSLAFYFIFLQLLTELGSRNYFTKNGFTAFFHFYFSLLAITSLFYFNKRVIPSIILSLSIVILSFHGIKQIINPVANNNVSINESKNVFNSMYMSYCYSAESVPVYLRKAVYPYVPIPEIHFNNWFGKSYSKVFSQSVINDDSVHYLPKFYAVNSVNELYSELERLREIGGNRCLDIFDSPYYIQLAK